MQTPLGLIRMVAFHRGGVDAQYLTMDLEDIKKLKVAEMADNPSVLLMWATFPLLKEAFEVIESWGFEYKSLGFSWIKTNQDGSPFFGIGYYAKRQFIIDF